MAHSLRSFLDELGPRLRRVELPLDPVTQAGYACSESRGPVLFTNLTGYPGMSLCDILVKSRESQGVALGCPPGEVVRHLAACFARGPGAVRRVTDAPCKEVRWLGDDVDVRRLPIPIHSEGDGGRYIGSGITITRDRETGVRNEAIIRAMVAGPRRLPFLMSARHSWAQVRGYVDRGEPAPMAYVIGLHPAYEIAANFTGRHDGHDELMLGASILDEELELVPCETIPLDVPAQAEIVIEGWVHPTAREHEGPFGEFTTYRAGAEGPAPVWELTAITHREQPIFRHMQATTFTDHQALIGLPMEAALLNHLRGVQGNTRVHDVHVPPWASSYVTLIQLTAEWDGQVEAVLMAAMSGPYLHPKIVIAVDEDVDIYNAEEVLWALSCRVDPERDVIVARHQRMHPLDISVPTAGEEYTVMRTGGKLGINATKPPRWRRAEREQYTRVRPQGYGDPALQRILELVRQPGVE